MPKPPQQLPAQLQGNQDCQLKPQLPSQTQSQDTAQVLGAGGGEAERSLAWRIPLLRFIIEARTILNVATSDDQVKQRMLLGKGAKKKEKKKTKKC